MAEQLPQAIPRDDITHVMLESLEFSFDLGAVSGLMAVVLFGTQNGDGFVESDRAEIVVNKNQLLAALSNSEKAALLSIRSKIVDQGKIIVSANKV